MLFGNNNLHFIRGNNQEHVGKYIETWLRYARISLEIRPLYHSRFNHERHDEDGCHVYKSKKESLVIDGPLH
jgi:hypothetical protein